MQAATVIAIVREHEDNMTTIKTTAPIPIDDLKQYFTDNTCKFEIDYSSSTLKGTKLLIYLGNLSVPSNIISESNDEFLDLLKDYFNSRTLVSIERLDVAAMEILFNYKFGINPDHKGSLTTVQIEKFINENSEILLLWHRLLDSLTVYNMKTVNLEEFNEFVNSFPEDKTDDLLGINFVNQLQYEEFYQFYSEIKKENLFNYSVYFNEYMFKGKNLFHFWGTPKNPLFLLTFGIASGEFTNEDFKQIHA